MQETLQMTEASGYACVIACVGTNLLLFAFESHSFLPFFPYYLRNNFILLQTTCTNDNTS